MKIVSALVVVFIVLVVGGYFLFAEYRCRAITVCFVENVFQVNGVKYKVNQSKIDEFIRTHKKTKTISKVWLWQPDKGQYGVDQRIFANRKTELQIEIKKDGKIISAIPDPIDSTKYIQTMGLLGEHKSSKNILTFFITPEYERIIDINSLNGSLGETLYWMISGEGYRDKTITELIDKI